MYVCVYIHIYKEREIRTHLSPSAHIYIYIYKCAHIKVVAACLIVRLFGLSVITRHHELGVGRNLPGILPTILPELPIQLRDLRIGQKSLKTYF